MSILIIRGPHAAPWQDPKAAGPDGDTMPSLAQRAFAAGKTLVVRSCTTARELVDCLRQAKTAETEMVLLDPGEISAEECRQAAPELRDALDRLDAPYIEVHDDSGHALEPVVMPQKGPLVTVVMNGDLAQSYHMALTITLLRLGGVRHPRLEKNWLAA